VARVDLAGANSWITRDDLDSGGGAHSIGPE
jgi:hypothetical protein